MSFFRRNDDDANADDETTDDDTPVEDILVATLEDKDDDEEDDELRHCAAIVWRRNLPPTDAESQMRIVRPPVGIESPHGRTSVNGTEFIFCRLEYSTVLTNTNQ